MAKFTITFDGGSFEAESHLVALDESFKIGRTLGPFCVVAQIFNEEGERVWLGTTDDNGFPVSDMLKRSAIVLQWRLMNSVKRFQWTAFKFVTGADLNCLWF